MPDSLEEDNYYFPVTIIKQRGHPKNSHITQSDAGQVCTHDYFAMGRGTRIQGLLGQDLPTPPPVYFSGSKANIHLKCSYKRDCGTGVSQWQGERLQEEIQ
jgi:hypothetical protein